jgi:cytochrome b561
VGLRNDAGGYGAVTRALHWIMAAGVIATLPLGLYIARMEPALSTIWLYGLHKTLGMTLLGLLVLRLAWHASSPPPAPLPGPWARVARGAHRALYGLLIVVPVAGWVASSATGIDTVIFGSVTVPAIAPASPDLETAAFAVHRAGAWLLGALVVLHAAAAVWHALRGDGTLRRMIRGRAA